MAETLAADRLGQHLQEIRARGRSALIGYLVAGDPDLTTSEMVISAVAAAGIDVLELGFPYSDPLADGPTIAAAGQRALAAGTTIDACLDLVERVHHLVPTILFTYFNPVFQFGTERFAQMAARAGAWGVIIPDITVEEIDEVSGPLHAHQLAMPLLIAPTTNPARARRIAAASDGFIYVVSRLGVTGEGSEPDLDWLRNQVERLRQVTDKPLAVGFGISSPAQVGKVAPWADGVIIGSALVGSYSGHSGATAAQLAADYVGSLTSRLGREA
jgi:tryptophan synthase alpha chain